MLMACVLYASACSEDSDVNDTKIIMEAPVISNITLNSAEVKVIIKGAIFKERGVCYSTFKNPNMLNNKIMTDAVTDEFSIVLNNLSTNTKYYVRTYAVLTDKRVLYSDIINLIQL